MKVEEQEKQEQQKYTMMDVSQHNAFTRRPGYSSMRVLFSFQIALIIRTLAGAPASAAPQDAGGLWSEPEMLEFYAGW